jgi:hypothetical protein
MGEKLDVAFLLGAGAVVDAGLPTAIGLTKKAEKSIEGAYPQLLPALRYISGAIQFGKSCRGEPLSDSINVEELLTACKFLASRHTQPAYPFVSAWHERISELQRLPEEIPTNGVRNSFEFLFDYCRNGLREWLATPDVANLKYLRNFIDFINKGYRLRIFTLNYDDCVENALKDLLGPVNERWATGFDENGWNAQLLSEGKHDAYLYKLHGSLDWVRDVDLGICSVRWPQAKWTEELPSDFDPLLIFGVDTKLQAVDPFLPLLFHFQQVLNFSNVLVIIGYSFGDEYINAMILSALQSDPKMRCIVVSSKGTTGLEERSPAFKRMIAVEERFLPLPHKAKDAFEYNHILNAVGKVFQVQGEEEPF